MINRMRAFVYRFALLITAIFAVLFVLFLIVLKVNNEVLKERELMVTIAVTLAGFLFAGQGILLSLPANNRFIQDVKRYGYMTNFHRMCRFSELAFLFSVVIGFKAFSNEVIDVLFLFTFFWGLTLAFWAIFIFGEIVQRFTRSEHSKP